MATQLNIKDAETVRKARDLAQAKGQPVTAFLRALVDREWDEREARKKAQAAADLRFVHELQESVRRKVPPEMRGGTLKEIMDSIYDDESPDGFAR